MPDRYEPTCLSQAFRNLISMDRLLRTSVGCECALPHLKIYWICAFLWGLFPFGLLPFEGHRCEALAQAVQESPTQQVPPPSPPRSAVEFERDILPIFEQHCLDCHAGETAQSGFRLDIKSLALRGGDNHGPDIIPGDPVASPLVQMLKSNEDSDRMPPDQALSPPQIELIEQWIVEGADWPDGIDTATVRDKSDHWAFKPLRSPFFSSGMSSGEEKIPSPSHRPDSSSRPDSPTQSLETIDSKRHLPGPPRPSIDGFIRDELSAVGLQQNPRATDLQLLRRLSFNLTGLPPSDGLVGKYLAGTGSFATNPELYQQLVDELLDSPHYGERFAQHWLDLVRYADTHGFEVNTERPNAWPYRDYVIEAFNHDTPFDQFIREQIAGDQLGRDAATGFLVTASVLLPGQIGADDASKRLARQDALDEMVNNISQTFLGLSVGCARCHDHKFDPVTAKDYYAMQSFVAGVDYDERPVYPEPSEARNLKLEAIAQKIESTQSELGHHYPLANSGPTRSAIHSDRNIDRFPPQKTRRLRFRIGQTNKYEPCIDEMEVYDTSGNNVASRSAQATATASGQIQSPNRHDLEFINDGVYGNSSSWMGDSRSDVWVQIEFPAETTIERVEWGRDRHRKFYDRTPTDYSIEIEAEDGQWLTVASHADREEFVQDGTWSLAKEFASSNQTDLPGVASKLQELETLVIERTKLTQVPKVFAGVFRKPDTIYLLNRGDPEQPGPEVVPAFLASFDFEAPPPADVDELARRRSLADWIASPANPLTARVIVNRVWQWHFGTGIVSSPSDFGNNGFAPSHPELLDWLALEFIESGWSIKRLNRLILTSETYMQSSRHQLAASKIDADNRLLWKFPMRRLEAEAIRDAMLSVSGELNLQAGGPGYDLFNLRGGLTGFVPIEQFAPAGLRRMIYAHKVRRETDVVFGAFDCPDGGQSTATRTRSTTPIQVWWIAM